MPKQIIEYRCLLISPGDVAEERKALTDMVTLWNAQIGVGLGARVELVKWESHTIPDMSDTAQNVINAQLLDDCDIGIAVFWSRLGTPTTNHASGSVEEIYRLLRNNSRVMVYFSNRPIPQNVLHDDQYAKLQDIRKAFQEQGLLATYSDVNNLREQVQLHLTNVITQLLSKEIGGMTYIPSTGAVTAPTPDIRVTAFVAFAQHLKLGMIKLLRIKVSNHSPVNVFLEMLELK